MLDSELDYKEIFGFEVRGEVTSPCEFLSSYYRVFI